MALLNQFIANGVIAGSIYSLVALGYTMVYGILKFINFAHGEVFMIGAYIGWLLSVVLGFNLVASFIISMLVCTILGFLIEKVAYKPLRNAGRLAPLITAIALSLFFQAAAILIFGAGIRSYGGGHVERGITILGATVTKLQVVIVFVSIFLMVLMHVYIKYTKTGRAIRATADNLQLASVVGINTDKVISRVFMIGSALAAAAGVLIGMESNLNPTMGVPIGIKAFTASVVGGIGNIYGALLGGYLIGIVENLGILYLPSGYKDAIAFFILIIFLLVRPQGIFGIKEEVDRI